ncbi:aminopeptidase [Alkalihalobacillus sp. LMS39]|uniref:aminopeptidase n=1 Tax=Alkalihalobacillus sp. LMS39 TaxID=2924032 RepID=UPI001FB3BBE0|nr:aminopeptidase [Alkalihalobacillus sp. LMS39]UOE94558.1 aminopeptidase [Alkalihalobacillus sp. LMS39]
MSIQLQQLAQTVVTYSINVQPGENVYIHALDLKDTDVLLPFIEEIYKAGGHVFVDISNYQLNRKMMLLGSEEQFTLDAKFKLEKVKEMDAIIFLLGEDNVSEYADVPAEKRNRFRQAYKAVSDEEVKKKWVVFNYPTKAYAQLAGMSTEAYTNFVYETCTADYSKLSKAMNALVELMEKTDNVRIVAPNTDLQFSIKGIPAIKCDGKVNLPDGEVFTAPIKDSVNGTISFNTKAMYSGQTFDNVQLTFKDGKVIDCTNDQRLIDLLDSDEGSRYLGEFAIGLNPHINNIMNDIGFDEKINGSVHFALGDAYEDADNGNKSSIHWDIVLLLKPEFGGGEIYFDDRLISKDGRFVVEELLGLNPEALR